MDSNLIRTVVSSVVFGLTKATYLKMNSGKEFRRPQIVPSPTKGSNDSFGVINPEEPDETFILNIADVEIIY